MKKTVGVAMLISVLMAGGMGGCQGGAVGRDPDDYAGGVVSDIRTQASEEFKKALANEISAFFSSDDLSKTLGIDSGEQDKLEESIRAYISSYSMDEEKLGEAKDSLDALLGNAEGLSLEELQDRVSRIFANE